MSSARKFCFATAIHSFLLLSLFLIPDAPARGQEPTAEKPAPGRWGRLAPVPEKSEEFIFATANGKLYLFGGTGGGKARGLVQEYDAAADKWTQKKIMPLLSHHMIAAEYRNKIYLFGGIGQGSEAPISNSWEYDPAEDSWKALAPMPTSRQAGAAAEVGGKIYVMGGALGRPVDLPLDTNEAYDPATNKWEARMSLPTARNHMAIGAVNGKIYVIAGRLGTGTAVLGSNTDVVEEYDPAKDTWGVVRAKMPTARSGIGWATHNGKIYVIGGEQLGHLYGVFRDVEAYDPAANSWSILPQLPTGRHGVNVAAIGNRLYAIGGHISGAGSGGAGANTDVNEAYEFPDK